MPEINYKLVIIAALFAVLVVVRLLAGGRPFDSPVRRKRRFGYRGTESPLRQPPGEAKAEDPPPDPEQEFFGDGHDGGSKP